eukprot:Blabericola_migrator_1__9331@NODE_501_length_7987_cov_46_570707_g383_i0_p1_GENE_NODE_501_length_7987_cov_46_570707_g383_i0NODE_501_length_7987_cov_46_570707_g383_i0_p1_ORF_typecomplete_len1044_score139_46_NODE_501_length_7987_cov_46_570707_g383_i036356766
MRKGWYVDRSVSVATCSPDEVRFGHLLEVLYQLVGQCRLQLLEPRSVQDASRIAESLLPSIPSWAPFNAGPAVSSLTLDEHEDLEQCRTFIPDHLLESESKTLLRLTAAIFLKLQQPLGWRRFVPPPPATLERLKKYLVLCPAFVWPTTLGAPTELELDNLVSQNARNWYSWKKHWCVEDADRVSIRHLLPALPVEDEFAQMWISFHHLTAREPLNELAISLAECFFDRYQLANGLNLFDAIGQATDATLVDCVERGYVKFSIVEPLLEAVKTDWLLNKGIQGKHLWALRTLLASAALFKEWVERPKRLMPKSVTVAVPKLSPPIVEPVGPESAFEVPKALLRRSTNRTALSKGAQMPTDIYHLLHTFTPCMIRQKGGPRLCRCLSACESFKTDLQEFSVLTKRLFFLVIRKSRQLSVLSAPHLRRTSDDNFKRRVLRFGYIYAPANGDCIFDLNEQDWRRGCKWLRDQSPTLLHLAPCDLRFLLLAAAIYQKWKADSGPIKLLKSPPEPHVIDAVKQIAYSAVMGPCPRIPEADLHRRLKNVAEWPGQLQHEPFYLWLGLWVPQPFEDRGSAADVMLAGSTGAKMQRDHFFDMWAAFTHMASKGCAYSQVLNAEADDFSRKYQLSGGRSILEELGTAGPASLLEAVKQGYVRQSVIAPLLSSENDVILPAAILRQNLIFTLFATSAMFNAWSKDQRGKRVLEDGSEGAVKKRQCSEEPPGPSSTRESSENVCTLQNDLSSDVRAAVGIDFEPDAQQYTEEITPPKSIHQEAGSVMSMSANSGDSANDDVSALLTENYTLQSDTCGAVYNIVTPAVTFGGHRVEKIYLLDWPLAGSSSEPMMHAYLVQDSASDVRSELESPMDQLSTSGMSDCDHRFQTSPEPSARDTSDFDYKLQTTPEPYIIQPNDVFQTWRFENCAEQLDWSPFILPSTSQDLFTRTWNAFIKLLTCKEQPTDCFWELEQILRQPAQNIASCLRAIDGADVIVCQNVGLLTPGTLNGLDMLLLQATLFDGEMSELRQCFPKVMAAVCAMVMAAHRNAWCG